MKNLNISIIGAGTAGMSASIFLKKLGHTVTIFERFDNPRPLGAGLMLQPSGLAVLNVLGLDKKIIDSGSKIFQLIGKESGKTYEVLNARYSSLGDHLFGVGTHRGNLFTTLYDEVLKNDIKIVTSQNITEVRSVSDNKNQIINSDGEELGEFDFVIDASGSKSYFLSKAIEESETLSQSFKKYNSYRKANIKFYQMASRFLTPFFQSDSKLFAKLRLFTCTIPCKIPLTQKYGARVLTGTKTGIFSSMNPEDWAEDYKVN